MDWCLDGCRSRICCFDTGFLLACFGVSHAVIVFSTVQRDQPSAASIFYCLALGGVSGMLGLLRGLAAGAPSATRAELCALGIGHAVWPVQTAQRCTSVQQGRLWRLAWSWRTQRHSCRAVRVRYWACCVARSVVQACGVRLRLLRGLAAGVELAHPAQLVLVER